MKEGFNRINFFKGFFTQAEDWQAAQEYHLEKRKLHNKFLHTPGVVFGCLDDLRVTATEQGTSLYVAPGYAIDGEGHDLYLPKPEKISIVPSTYRPPAIVYVVIRYHEERIDRRQNAANPEYSDFAFVREWPLVEIVADEPDNHQALELARIALSRNAVRVMDAKNPDNPGADEINLKFIKQAGVVTEPASITRGNLGQTIKEGEIGVVASRELTPSENDTNVLIERVEGPDPHRFYLVSAYPSEQSRILWRIESSFSGGSIEYRLFLKNLSQRAVTVFYKIYSL